MPGLRLKFERRNNWRCCFCCHVRTGTIFLGVWNVITHIIVMTIMAITLKNPELLNQELNPVLPTPLSEVDAYMEFPNTNSDMTFLNRSSMKPQTAFPHKYKSILEQRKFSHENVNVGIVITFCTFAMTLLLLYGAIKGKPSYLMPFFCLQVFDFCLVSLSAVGFLCYPPDIQPLIRQNSHLPLKEEMLSLHPQTLNLLVAIVFLIVMSTKAYFIGVLWSCYKYLTLRKVAAQRTVQFNYSDGQNLLPDLPDYETAVKKYPTPPPSYSTAMQGQQYPVFVDINNSMAYNSQPLAAQNIVVPPLPTGATPQSHSSNQASIPQQV